MNPRNVRNKIFYFFSSLDERFVGPQISLTNAIFLSLFQFSVPKQAVYFVHVNCSHFPDGENSSFHDREFFLIFTAWMDCKNTYCLVIFIEITSSKIEYVITTWHVFDFKKKLIDYVCENFLQIVYLVVLVVPKKL